MDDRGEGASYQDVSLDSAEESAELLDSTLDATVVVNTAAAQDSALSAVERQKDTSQFASFDEADATILDSTLDNTMDATIVVTPDSAQCLDDAMDAAGPDWVDRVAVLSSAHSVAKTKAKLAIVSERQQQLVASADEFFDALDNDAPAPPPVCQAGAVVTPSESMRQGRVGGVWVEAPVRRSAFPLARVLTVAALALGCAAAVYGYKQYQAGLLFADSAPELAEQEALPPEGRGLMLNTAQVRYCLAQGARLGSAAEHSASLGGSHAARLQALFTDYGKRCTDFQFAPGAVIAAEVAVEAQAELLQRQGVRLLAPELSDAEINTILSAQQSSDSSLVVAPSAEPKPVVAPAVPLEPVAIADVSVAVADERTLDENTELAGIVEQQSVSESTATITELAEQVDNSPAVAVQPVNIEPSRKVKDLQWRLFKLDFYHGGMDGIYSESTQRSVDEFFESHQELKKTQDIDAAFKAVDSVYSQAQ